MHEIVKYHNKLNNFNYGRFSAVEGDIFFTLLSKISNTDGTLVMTFDELKEISGYYSSDEKRFVRDVERTFTKYLTIRYREETDRYIKINNVFSYLQVDKDERTVKVKVTEGMEWAVFALNENFTRFELNEFTRLKSTYAKSIYRLLKQWRHCGEHVPMFTVEELKFKLDIPKNYRQCNIDQRVLAPAITELNESGCFKNLEVHKEYEKRHGRGRPKVIGYQFSFKSEPRYQVKQARKHHLKPSQQKVAQLAGYTPTSWYCPRCHRPIYKKQLEKNGKYFLFGHADFRTGGCNFKTFDVADLLRKEHLPPSEPTTDQQKENRKKIDSIVSGMFKK